MRQRVEPDLGNGSERSWKRTSGSTWRKLAGAAAGAMISLVYLVPKGRREAVSRFVVGLLSGLVFGSAVGAALAERFGLAGRISGDRDRADRLRRRQPLRLVGARRAVAHRRAVRPRVSRPPVPAGEPRTTNGQRGEPWIRAQTPLARQTKFAGLELRDGRRRRLLLGLCEPLRRGRSRPRRHRARAPSRPRSQGAARPGVRMLFQHDPAEPIGAWSVIREDGRGLYVEGRLATGVARAREVHDLMKAGALDGLSIGFEAVRARCRRQDRAAPHSPGRSLGDLGRHLSHASGRARHRRQAPSGRLPDETGTGTPARRAGPG